MQGKRPVPPNDPDWERLLDVERQLEAEIAGAEGEAHERVANARAAAASALPDPAALTALAAAQDQADRERQRGELARISERSAAAASALEEAPRSLIDTLAQLALGAVLTDKLPEAPR